MLLSVPHSFFLRCLGQLVLRDWPLPPFLQMQKLLTFSFSKNISVYAIFNDQSFNDTLINDIVSFEQFGPGLLHLNSINS